MTFESLVLFVWALLSHWTALITGSLITALLVAVPSAMKRKISSWAIPAVLIGGFIPACYLAWLTERENLVWEKSLHHPVFRPIIEYAFARDLIKPGHSAHAVVFLQVSLRNSGAQSICEFWKAYVKNQNAVWRGTRVAIPENMLLVPLSANEGVFYHSLQDDLTLNTTKQPILENGGAKGWIAFEFPAQAAQISQLGDQLWISCRDALYEEWWAAPLDASTFTLDRSPGFADYAPYWAPGLSTPQPFGSP